MMIVDSDTVGLDALHIPLDAGDLRSAAVRDAASRQKSCNTCVRGKRRCDKRMPRCTRCAVKNLDCVYKRPHTSSRHPAAAATPSPTSASPSASTSPTTSTTTSSASAPASASASTSTSTSTSASASCGSTSASSAPALATMPAPSAGCAQDIHFSFDCPPAFDMPSGMPSLSDPSPDSLLNFSITDFLTPPDSGEAGINLWDIHLHDPVGSINLSSIGLGSGCAAGGASKMDIEAAPEAPRDLLANTAMGPGDTPFISVDVELVHDRRSKIGYVLHEMMQMHSVFAQRRATPFLHPRLYAESSALGPGSIGGALPRSMVLAFSAAKAYAGHTRETRGWALKSVQQAVKEVYRDAERPATPAAAQKGAGSDASAASAGVGVGNVAGVAGRALKLEKLARLQALLLLNSVRLFDGDVGSRSAAERELGVMVSWTKGLVGLRREMEGGLPPSMVISRDRLPQSWESWILLESTRRTILTSFAMVCLFCLLKDGHAPCYLWAEDESFTASKHLWEAQSSVDFFRAWREKPQYCVTNMGFRDFWSSARPEDLDDFTKLMLAPQVGVEAIEHFEQGDATVPI